MAIDITLIFSATGQSRAFSSRPLCASFPAKSVLSQLVVTQSRDLGIEGEIPQQSRNSL